MSNGKLGREGIWQWAMESWGGGGLGTRVSKSGCLGFFVEHFVNCTVYLQFCVVCTLAINPLNFSEL